MSSFIRAAMVTVSLYSKRILTRHTLYQRLFLQSSPSAALSDFTAALVTNTRVRLAPCRMLVSHTMDHQRLKPQTPQLSFRTPGCPRLQCSRCPYKVSCFCRDRRFNYRKQKPLVFSNVTLRHTSKKNSASLESIVLVCLIFKKCCWSF